MGRMYVYFTRVKDYFLLNDISFFHSAAYLNCIAYVTYAILRKDYYVFFANVPGLCLAIYYSLTAITILATSKKEEARKTMDTMIKVLIFGFFFFSVLGFIAGTVYSHSDDEREKAATVLGMTGVGYSILYYFAPLSTAWTVITTRNSASLYLPMLLLNLTNALLWTFYGLLAVNQPAVWVPNIVGGVITLFLLFLVLIFPSKQKDFDEIKSTGDVEESLLRD